MLRNDRDCSGCFQASECILYHAALEDGTRSTSGAPQLFDDILSALNPLHLSYIKHWECLLDLEQAATKATNNKIWSTSSEVRENRGDQCIGGLKLVSCIATSSSNPDGLAIDNEGICAEHHLILASTSIGFPLASDESSSMGNCLDSSLTMVERCKCVGISIGDRIVVSIEGNHISQIQKQDSDRSRPHVVTNQHEQRSTMAIMDIEDISLPSNSSFNRAHIDVEPNIAAGTILCINDHSIVISTENVSKRLKRYTFFVIVKFYMSVLNECVVVVVVCCFFFGTRY